MATTFGCRPQQMFRITKIVFDSKYSSSLLKLLQYNFTYIHNIRIKFCWPLPKTFGPRPQHISFYITHIPLRPTCLYYLIFYFFFLVHMGSLIPNWAFFCFFRFFCIAAKKLPQAWMEFNVSTNIHCASTLKFSILRQKKIWVVLGNDFNRFS